MAFAAAWVLLPGLPADVDASKVEARPCGEGAEAVETTRAGELTHDTYSSASLGEWQVAFWALYGHHDVATPLYDLVLQMMVDATRLVEAIRKERLAEALPFVPRTFSWLCNIVTKCASNPEVYRDLGILTPSLGELTWSKYPNLCSLCAQSRCVCPWLGLDREEGEMRIRSMEARASILEIARANRSDFPKTLDGWSTMFEHIYGVPHARMTMAEKALHLMEEVGEVEYELRKAERVAQGKIPPGREQEYSRIDFRGELSDVFSWLLTVHHHIALALGGAQEFMAAYEKRRGATGKLPHISLPSFSDWLWVEFGDQDTGRDLRCHRCGKSVCRCDVALTRR